MNNSFWVNHILNQSKSKQTHLFSRQKRFINPKKITTDKFYQIPSSFSKKATSFGYGNKSELAIRTNSPPPGSYKLQSDFQTKKLNNATTIGVGRDKIYFGSFIYEATKNGKNTPSPNKYLLPSTKNTSYGHIGERIKTDIDSKYKKSIPGPGSYNVNSIDIAKGSFCLSTLKNTISPRYYTVNSSPKSNNKINTSVSYDIQQKQSGKFYNSKYQNTITRTFSRSKRPGPQNKHALIVPGFKYKRFSQFGSNL